MADKKALTYGERDELQNIAVAISTESMWGNVYTKDVQAYIDALTELMNRVENDPRFIYQRKK